jgi:cytochrome b6-f complex iron-sulfur subunit
MALRLLLTLVDIFAAQDTTTLRRPRAQGRRAWLRWATLGAVAVAAGQLGVAAARLAWPNGVWERDRFAIPVERLPPVGGPPLRHDEGRFYLVRAPEGVLALSWRCTHLGCTLPWHEDEGLFRCPCHPSRFDRYGDVLPGSVALRPLDAFEVSVASGVVYVNTARRRQRERGDAGPFTTV